MAGLGPAAVTRLLLDLMTWTCSDLLGRSLAYIYGISVSLMRVIWYLLWITEGGSELRWCIVSLGETFLPFYLSLSLSVSSLSSSPLKLIPPSALSSKLQNAWNEVRLIGQEPFCEHYLFINFFGGGGYLGTLEFVWGRWTSADRIIDTGAKWFEALWHQFSSAAINQMLFFALTLAFQLSSDRLAAAWTRWIRLLQPGIFC